MKKKIKTIDEYVTIAKYDIIVWIFVTILLTIGLLIYSYKQDFYDYLFFLMIPIFFSFSKILTYINVKMIKNYLIKNNLIQKIGKIYFWNDKNYFLTDNYMIILNKIKIVHFEYDDITEIYKINEITGRHSIGMDEYLNIKLKNNNVYKVLISSTKLVDETTKDITEFLLKKNPNINIKK